MKPQFQHEATTSFSLWLDNYFLKKGEAFSNIQEGEMFYKEDFRIPQYPEDPFGYVTYSSEYKQWVYNKDLDNAKIPEGVYVDSGDGYKYVKKGENGLSIDFDNGRVLLSGIYYQETYSDLKIKTDFSIKDINVYLASETEENIILEKKYNTNSRSIPDYGKGTGIPPYEPVVPAAFISMERTNNRPFALGGEDLTTLYFRTILFTENLYQLDGAMSLCADACNLGVCNIGYDNYPLNEYGDLKDSDFYYSKTVNECAAAPNIMFIESVNSSKINDRISSSNNPSLHLGYIDFTVSQARFPRA
jgi:hypothetical protein